MSIFNICAILVSAFAFAQKGAAPREYVLVPAERCALVRSEDAKELCSVRFSGDVTQYKLIPSGRGSANFEMTVYNSGEADSKELLCYRCTLKKVGKDTCGRYKNVWGKADKVKDCPRHE